MEKKTAKEQREEKKKQVFENVLNTPKSELLSILQNNVGHFNNKYTNTKSKVFLLKENNFKSNLNYLSMSTLGLTYNDLCLTNAAQNITKFTVIKAFLINDMEKIKQFPNHEELLKKFQSDLETEGAFHQALNEVANQEPELDPYCKQLLVFDDDENDYVSLTPLSSLYLNTKLKGALLNKVEQLKEEAPEDEKNKIKNFWKTVNLDIGGTKPQNVGIDASFNYSNNFCLLMDNPTIKNNNISNIYHYLFNGIKYNFNPKDLNLLSLFIKNYNNNKNHDNKLIVINKVKEIANKHIQKCLHIKKVVNQQIFNYLKQKNDEINFNDPINDLFKPKNHEIKNTIFNGKFKDLEIDTEAKIYLTNKFKENIDILTNHFVQYLILSNNKENIFNYNEEIIKILSTAIKEVFHGKC